jgi:hypothetical protein
MGPGPTTAPCVASADASLGKLLRPDVAPCGLMSSCGSCNCTNCCGCGCCCWWHHRFAAGFLLDVDGKMAPKCSAQQSSQVASWCQDLQQAESTMLAAAVLAGILPSCATAFNQGAPTLQLTLVGMQPHTRRAQPKTCQGCVRSANTLRSSARHWT